MDLPNWVDDILDVYKGKIKGSEVFLDSCPFCDNTSNKFYGNFSINVRKNIFHCWACEVGGSVKRLLRFAGIDYEDEDVQVAVKKKKKESGIILPETSPIYGAHSRAGLTAKNFLKNRGVTGKTIKDWKMGIGIDEEHFGNIIVPFEGIKGDVEFYSMIGYLPNVKKYKLPDTTKDKFVPKRKGATSIVLIEGIFDGTSVWQFSPYDILILYGKHVQDHQIEMFQKINYKKVFVCLDGDAINEGIKLAYKLFKAGINSYVTILPKGKDPNDIGTDINKFLDESIRFTVTTSSRLKRELLNENNRL